METTSTNKKWKTTSIQKWKMTSKEMEDDLKRNGKQPQKKWKTTSKNKKWTTSSTIKSTLIGCDTIVN
jgi:predicted house-cleaning NTP pyrophosphatase (Maf/HAM1 superfamily)